MGAPVVIRQRAADINSGVNSRDECRNATSPVGTTEGNIIGSIVVGALVAWRLLVPMLSLDYIYHLRCHPNSPVPYGGPSFIHGCRIVKVSHPRHPCVFLSRASSATSTTTLSWSWYPPPVSPVPSSAVFPLQPPQDNA